MAVLNNNRIRSNIEKERKKLDSLQRKMEIQRKKEEFGESWKYSLKDEQKKALEDIVGDLETPKIKDSIDINAFFDPINFYRDKKGDVNDFDYEAYCSTEQAYEDAINECDRVINDEEETEDLSASSTLKKEIQKQEIKEKEKPKVPSYIQKYYQSWSKYFTRFVPLYDKYVCSCCGKPQIQDKFFLTYSESNLGRIEPDGKMHSHVCIDCSKKLYEYLYYEKANNDGEGAMKWFCSYLNIYFDEVTYFKARETMIKNKKKNHIVEEYMKLVNKSAALKGKVFLESPNLDFGGVKGEEKDAKIINSDNGSVADDIEEKWTKDELKTKGLVLKMFGYDPFFYESDENRKVLYKDMLGMLENGMEFDMLKLNAAREIVLSFLRIRNLNVKYNELERKNASTAELKAVTELKQKELTAITNFSRDNGFGERYAVSKAKGENTFTGIMAKMNEMKYEKAILNMYDIETSASIQQAAEASFKAIFGQLGLSEAEVYKICQDQLKKLTEMERKNSSLTEEVRKLKYELAKRDLEEKAKAQQSEDSEDWEGY